jgi:hypothetical protein
MLATSVSQPESQHESVSESSSFLKKRTKKLLLIRASGAITAAAHD